MSELLPLPQPKRDEEVPLERRSMWMKEEVSEAPWPWKRTRLAFVALLFATVGCRGACSAP